MRGAGRSAAHDRGNVTKVTWTKGQRGSILFLGGKAVLGEGCLASCEPSQDACFFADDWQTPLLLRRPESRICCIQSNITE
jgi:hypothetical protein